MREGVFEAIKAVCEATGEESVNAIGYCVGGTLLAIALAAMAASSDKRIRSVTFSRPRSISNTRAISRCSPTRSRSRKSSAR